ncbi:MAG: ABC transporter ATP-binding protein [Betaproteobacteria bacterium]|nr:MAG: ABC transporter ATP-binding protein [Betaproteobacteria bacterium]
MNHPTQAPVSKGTLEFRNVVKDYGTGEPAVKGISFRIEDGDLVTLLGPSGCGKTTTLRMIAGLELPTKGQILLGGKDVTEKSASQRNVSLVFQSYALFPHMSVMENVCYGPTVQGMKKPQAEAKANDVLKLIGLTGYETRLPSELSGGQQQRVAIARALVLEPAVLLFDEPLSNLDTKLRRHVREEIRELQQRLAITCVYVTHDREEAMAVSDHIIVMNKGGIAEAGSPNQLYFQPHTAFVADFLSEANVVDAHIALRADGGADVALADAKFAVAADAVAANATKAALRPDVFSLTQREGDDVSVAATVSKAAFVGKGIELVASTGAGDLFVFLPKARLTVKPGDAIRLWFSSSEVRLIV